MKFNELGIIPEILDALKASGYESPTPIQEKAIPAIINGRDVLGLAQTGTGKTAAFAVPTLQRLRSGAKHGKKRPIRALVLTPTRELGTQIYESFVAYSQNLPLKSTVIFGGVSQGKQVNALRSGVDILVATPGRLLDLMNQGYVKLSNIEVFILDEADRMLDMGFIHDIRRITKALPHKKQTLLFSATMPKEIEEIVDHLLVNPVHVSVAPVSSAVDTVEQYVQFVDQNHKIDLLTDYIKERSGEPVLVFTRTKRGADRVVKDLMRRHITAQAIHGNKSQNARQNALHNFKSYATQVLVATDIAARGIDIHELNYVVNYDLPEVPETYVHRIGRTGRAGNTGQSLSLVSFREIPLLRDIESLMKKSVPVVANEKFPMVDETPAKKQTKGKKQTRSEAEKRNYQAEKKAKNNRNKKHSSNGKSIRNRRFDSEDKKDKNGKSKRGHASKNRRQNGGNYERSKTKK